MQYKLTRERYIAEIEATMRAIVGDMVNENGLGLMLRYALGWVDEHDQPYHHTTGKRIRPILLLLINEAAGGNWRIALPAAAAVEILHNFSLVHDDIQDNSPIRHGRPTVWKIWGLANAINVGDALFTLAYSAIGQLNSQIEAERLVKILQVFNHTNLELTRGQHLDMHFEKERIVSLEAYTSMICGKSAALLAACAQIGAIIAHADPQQIDAFASFGLNLGIAFQIHDDILGIWGDPQVTGKSAATDILYRKKSLPILYGLNLSDQLMDIYQRVNFGEKEVQEAVAILDELQAKDYALEQEKLYYERAMTAFEEANPQAEAAERLLDFIQFLLNRNY